MRASAPFTTPVWKKMAKPKLSPDAQLAEDLSRYYSDPLGYVMYMFPWDSDKSIQQVRLTPEYRSRFGCDYGPDVWACKFLDDLGKDIRKRKFDGQNAVDPIQYVTTSGHGVGKSALVAWLIKFLLDTRPFSKGVVTANTATQLKTKTWAEVGKWHALSLTRDWFQYNSGRGNMSLFHREHKDTWRCDAQTCREEDSEAFAGLHAANSSPFFLFDEGSAVPDKIYEVREGGTTDGEPMTFDFGNPTRNSGRFFEECEGRFKKRYSLRRIDSRDVQITNKKRIEEWIEDYGLESDFVKVRVRGIFPSMGDLQFIPTTTVEEAMSRDDAVRDPAEALVIGVDIARFGNNETVIYPRIGYDARSFPPRRYRGLDMVQVEGKIIECVREFQRLGMECAGLFIDGGGIGGGVIDHLAHMGYAPIEVQFGGRPTEAQTYRFKVDEMWGNLKAALPRLVLPRADQPSGLDLKMQLTQREFSHTLAGDKINLESKRDMQSRLGGDMASPDVADALACTFAQEVAPRMMLDGTRIGVRKETQHDFDPLDGRY